MKLKVSLLVAAVVGHRCRDLACRGRRSNVQGSRRREAARDDARGIACRARPSRSPDSAAVGSRVSPRRGARNGRWSRVESAPPRDRRPPRRRDDLHLEQPPSARAPCGVASSPARRRLPGTIISAQVGIANGQLEEQDEDDVGQVANGTITVQATVAAVGADRSHSRSQGQTLTVPLPGRPDAAGVARRADRHDPALGRRLERRPG